MPDAPVMSVHALALHRSHWSASLVGTSSQEPRVTVATDTCESVGTPLGPVCVHVVPLYVYAVPLAVPTRQNVADVHETDTGWTEPMIVGGDQLLPLNVADVPVPSTPTQNVGDT